MSNLRVSRNFLTTERVLLKSGLYVEREAEITVTGHPSEGFDLVMKVEFDETLGKLVARDVSVRASGPGLEVTGTILRAVRVQDLLQQAGLLTMTKLSEGDHGSEMRADTLLESYMRDAEKHRKSPSAAAEIYEVASVLNYPPLKTLSDVLGVSQSTATRLVARAREQGLLQ